jgi:glycosyltransferase involved in cell wall biosynthesis
MKIQLIAKPEKDISGISRYTQDLLKCLKLAHADVQLTFSDTLYSTGILQSWPRRLGIDLQTFFSSFPLRVSLIPADIIHLTGQTLASCLLFQRFRAPVVVTVHDIIPFLLSKTHGQAVFRHPLEAFFYRLSLKGLRKADGLIAVSAYTKKTLCDQLGISPEKIFVVHECVDHQKFHPTNVPDSFYEKFQLNKGRYVLYVGSEDTRKNLETLIRAYAEVKRQHPGLKLLKVGAAQFMRERKRLLESILQLGLQEDILFFEQVPDEDLLFFYNLADVFVMPSFYEGFGLPVLEAMACGRPVIVSGSTSLPEIVGSAGILLDPLDVDTLARSMLDILGNTSRASALGKAAYQQAQKFQFSKQAEDTCRIYTQKLTSSQKY